jgi:hypothetical protein
MSKKDQPKVFISYSHDRDEIDWVKGFARTLEKNNVSVWLAEDDVKAGEPLVPAIERALRETDLFVLLLTKKNMQRPNILFEWGAAVGLGKPVIPIISRDIDPSTIPVALRLRQFLNRERPEDTADKLINETLGPLRKAQ